MSYANAEIDFSGIHLACLSGPNGAGKSTLLDAVTWALWEEGRSRTDDLIKLGKDEMSCELEFFSDSELYRVYRSRSKSFKNAQGKSSLEFQIFNPKDQQWTSLTLSSVRQTQDLITKTIRMDYETFVNSVYLRQGKADEFTLKKPAERKQILADILGLGIYDKLCDASKLKINEIEKTIGYEESSISELKTKIQAEDKIKTDCESYKPILEKEEKKLKEISESLKLKEAELNKMKEKEAHLNSLERTALSHKSLIQTLEEKLTNLKSKYEKYDTLIKNRTYIENEYKKHLDIQKKLELYEREKELYSQILQERNLLELQLKNEVTKSLKDSLSKVETNGLELKHDKELILLNLKKLAETKSDLNNKIDTLLLHKHSEPCPLCKGEIKDKQKVIESYRLELNNLEKEEKGLSGSLKQKDNELLEKRKRFNEILGISKGEFEKAKEHVLTQEKENISFIREIIEKLNSAMASLGNLKYDQNLYNELKKSLKEGENIVLKQKLLLEAESETQTLSNEIKNLTLKINSSREDLAKLEKSITEQKKQTENIKELIYEAEELRKKENEERGQLNEVKKQLIIAEQALTDIENSKKLVKEKELKINNLMTEKKYFDILEKAFSKNGIQVALIETTVPEIENEANRILNRLTDNQMHVALKTQKEKKSSTGIIETLDVIIADNAGSRNYELYSGGEAFKVNFSLRLALSRLLANRSSARLQTLIIDEGFGSQDSSGKERLVEAIRSIQNEFELILVVTHIDELKESFPVHIQVTKEPEGSKVKLVA